MYELQEDRSMPGLPEPDPNNEDLSIDLLDVCVLFPFEATSYDRIARVAAEHAGLPIQL